MRGAIALGTVKSPSRVNAVHSQAQSNTTQPVIKWVLLHAVFAVKNKGCRASGEASKDDIKYFWSQQCGAQARTLRTQDTGEIGTLHANTAQTVDAHAPLEHTISAAVRDDLHQSFVVVCLTRGII